MIGSPPEAPGLRQGPRHRPRRRAAAPALAGLAAAALVAVAALSGCKGSQGGPVDAPLTQTPTSYTVLTPGRALTGPELDLSVTILRARAGQLGLVGARVEPADDGQSVLVALRGAPDLVAALSATGTFEIRPVMHTGPGNELWAPSLPAGATALGTAVGQYRDLTCPLATSAVVPPVAPTLPAAACARIGTTKYLLQPAELERGDVDRVAPAANDATGGWVVDVAFTSAGQQRFTALTARDVGQQLALVVDGVVQSAPTIDVTILGDAEISGDLTEVGARRLAAVLASGSLPVPLTAAAPTAAPPPGYHG